MHDILTYVQKDPVYRRWEHQHLTFSMLYAFNENFILPFSHDEVVHGKRSMMDKVPGDAWQKAATLRVLYVFMCAHPGKKLLFMGLEFGQWREWSHDVSLEWHLTNEPLHGGLQRCVADLNRIYRAERALYEVDFEARRLLVDRLQRLGLERHLVRAPRARSAGLRGGRAELDARASASATAIGVPEPGYYRELLNTRRRPVRRRQHGQRGRRHVRAHPGARPRAVGRADAAAARRPAAQAGSDIAISDAHSASVTGMTDSRGMRVSGKSTRTACPP